MRDFILQLPRPVKQLTVVGIDVLLSLLATWAAFSLRLDILHIPSGSQWLVYGVVPFLPLPIFARFGLYRAVFRYSGYSALVATGYAVFWYAGLLTLGLLLLRIPGVPRTLGVLQPLIFLLLVSISRALARFWLANTFATGEDAPGRLLIYGAGAAGVETAAALSMSRQYKLVGYVDDDPAKVGSTLNGARVYAAQRLPELITEHRVTDILLAMPSASRERRFQILEMAKLLPVHVQTLPRLSDLATGRVTVQDIRELDVEDLLGRAPVPPRLDLLANELHGQVVLVTGAGGSIGSELTRQILAQRPRQLLLLDHNEFGLYTVHQELLALARAAGWEPDVLPLLGSVTATASMHALCARHRPAIVYHAAAYKHVPLVEQNPGQGIDNNVMGTLSMAQAARDAGVRRFVLVSTDKAVRPTNVMGATKRMAELILQAFAADIPAGGTCFSMVRFGNVLGSSGSVVPLFRRQIAQGGPITVTHPEVTRYFMTIPEAAQLVLQAGAMGEGGDVFVLDMGEPVKIMDLARRMVTLSGLSVRDADRPDGDIPITITGLRPGEKLYEELLIGDNPEATAAQDVPAMRAVLARCVQGFPEDPVPATGLDQ
ncbi:MAG: polysaccharide biosynthesis protein [Betaproteobacteria bacterium]|nr:polysaccharide biosynthesis protein [Betaproteobacteria bacterium]